MSRQNKRAADIGFAAITIEGGLISPEQVVAIASATPDQKTAADYGCPKGTSMRDEITRYFRIAQAHWQVYSRIEDPAVTQTAAFARSMLEEAFGFALTGPATHEREGRRFRIAWEAKDGRVPIVVAAPVASEKGKLGEGFSRAQPEFGDGPDGRIARRSPAVLLQDWLNANPDFYWGLVFAGDRVRLMRDNASFTRPAYIEADLGAIFRDEMFADFTALWLLIHSSRFGAEGAPPSDCALERWREAGMRAGTAARERLRGNVEDALLALGQGFLDVNPGLRQRLDEGAVSMPAFFEQLLRVVYRLIFLAVAEDRDLLHTPGAARAVKELYADNYGFSYLRDRCSRRAAHDHHADAWEGVKIVFRALERGEKLLGLPALGSLFARGLTPDLDNARLPNRALLGAAFKLGWLMDSNRRVRINWRDMATEELGSVYEGLLELVPTRENEGRTFTFAGGVEARGNARKVTGSYYTPDSLVQCLLDSALDPVLERAEAEGGAEAILKLNVIDPACGSGHFLLGAARRMATRVAQLRNSDAPDYNAAMRDVVRNCIHGVDRNPMAVELAKVALWIETVEPGKPLGFLDANIQCGDSLLGVFDLKALDEGIPDDAYKALTGDDKDTAKYFAKRNKDEKRGQGTLNFVGGGGTVPPAKLAAAMDDLRHLPEDTVAQVAEKRRRFAQWEADPRRYATKVACDLYIAAFLLPKSGGVPANANSVTVPTTAHLRTRLAGGQIYGPLEAAAVDAAGYARAFHWPLSFPEVMIGKGGFDAVLGNPPWDVMQLSDSEFFATSMPEIASETGARRKTAIEDLQGANPGIYQQYNLMKRFSSAATDFSRSSNRFPHSAKGKINTFALFADLFFCLCSEGGRSGTILPAEITTSETLSAFMTYLRSRNAIETIYSFENEEFVFPGIANVVKFCLMTLSKSNRENSLIVLANYLRTVGQLSESERLISLTPAELDLFTPTLGTLPIMRAKYDLELMLKVFNNQNGCRLSDEDKSKGWNVNSRLGLFNMAADSSLFSEKVELENSDATLGKNMRFSLDTDSYTPVYEGKFISHFDHRFSSYHNLGIEKGRGGRGLPPVKLEEYQNPNFEVLPRYWIDDSLVDKKLSDIKWESNWLLGWRDVANAKVERTITMAFLPRNGVGHTCSLLFSDHSVEEMACICANFNSIVVDYAARQIIGGSHVTFGYLSQILLIRPSFYSEIGKKFVVPRVLELSYTSHSLAPFARDLGYDGPPFTWDEDRRAQLRAELDGWYALAYGLTRDELRYVLDPKDVMGEDYPSETFRVLQKKEIAKYGEYRTQRLVLAAYDALVAQAMRPRVEGYR